MLSEKIEKELKQLVEIAKTQGDKLNSITFYNTFSSLPEEEKNADVRSEMEIYLTSNGIDIVSDEVEFEVEFDGDITSTIDKELKPFDPSKIDIYSYTLSMDNLLRRLKNNEIEFNTAFQRKSGLWSTKQKSQLIESLIIKIPLPAFYFDAENEDKWLIIDGLQRITTIKEFMIDQSLRLDGLEFFKNLEGLSYSELPRLSARRIEETNFISYIVRKGTPPNVKYNIFKRINTGGLELSPQEIRHALHQGNATNLLKKLADLKEFTDATGNSIRTNRMMDQEFALRYLAVCYYGIEHYDGLPDNFLSDTMTFLNSPNCPNETEIVEKFKKTMHAAYGIFQGYAFRKMGPDHRRRPINKAVYEIWCKGLHDLSEDDINKLVHKKQFVREKFIQSCENFYFLNMLRASDKRSYISRFHHIETSIKEVLDA